MAAAGGGQPPTPALRLVASDHLGVLRAAQVPPGLRWDSFAVVHTWGHPCRESAVGTMCAYSPSIEPGEKDCLLAVSRPGGNVDVLDSYTGEALGTCSGDGARGDVAGLAFLTSAPGLRRWPTLVTVTTSGCARICPWNDNGGWIDQATFQTAAAVSSMALHSTQAQMALGGEGCNVAFWDLTTQQRTWQAKAGRPNRSGLVDKPHVTALTFLSDKSPAVDAAGRESCVLAGTAGHKLLLYDPGAGRRPQLELDWGDARVTAMATASDGSGIWTANAKGMLELLDLRMRKMSHALKGATGSIRALAVHPRQELIASVGLDRLLRIHSTSSRCCVATLYLKQQLTGVAWLPPPDSPSSIGDVPPAPDVDSLVVRTGGKRSSASRQKPTGQPKRTRL